jgi:hypothetical protein
MKITGTPSITMNDAQSTIGKKRGESCDLDLPDANAHGTQ